MERPRAQHVLTVRQVRDGRRVTADVGEVPLNVRVGQVTPLLRAQRGLSLRERVLLELGPRLPVRLAVGLQRLA
jgi:hypothetical protein